MNPTQTITMGMGNTMGQQNLIGNNMHQYSITNDVSEQELSAKLDNFFYANK